MRNPDPGNVWKANNSSGELKVASCNISQKSGIRPKQPSVPNSCSRWTAQKSLWRMSGSMWLPIAVWIKCVFHRNQLRGEKGRWWGPTERCHRRSITLPLPANGQLMLGNRLSSSIIPHVNWKQSNVLQAQLVHLSASLRGTIMDHGTWLCYKKC